MNKIIELLGQSDVTAEAAIARLILALVAGSLIGLEREMRRQTAGLRTHILICLGSTVLTLLSVWMGQHYGAQNRGTDTTRIAAGIVSGIGFLGAGAIIKIGNNMKGLTTAASIWGVSAIGMGIGGGMWLPSLVALAFMLITLVLLEPIERKFFPAERIKVLQIDYGESTADRAKLMAALEAFGVSILSMDASQVMSKKETRVKALVRVPVNIDIEAFFKAVKVTGKVVKIKMAENY